MFESPAYVAFTAVKPTGNVEVVNVALWLLSCAVPSTVVPTVKMTGPVGTTVRDVITAVKVTSWPAVDGFGDEVSVAALVARRTTWSSTADVLRGFSPSPDRPAVQWVEPAFSLTHGCLHHGGLAVGEPMELPSHVKFTLPVG